MISEKILENFQQKKDDIVLSDNKKKQTEIKKIIFFYLNKYGEIIEIEPDYSLKRGLNLELSQKFTRKLEENYFKKYKKVVYFDNRKKRTKN